MNHDGIAKAAVTATTENGRAHPAIAVLMYTVSGSLCHQVLVAVFLEVATCNKLLAWDESRVAAVLSTSLEELSGKQSPKNYCLRDPDTVHYDYECMRLARPKSRKQLVEMFSGRIHCLHVIHVSHNKNKQTEKHSS